MITLDPIPTDQTVPNIVPDAETSKVAAAATVALKSNDAPSASIPQAKDLTNVVNNKEQPAPANTPPTAPPANTGWFGWFRSSKPVEQAAPKAPSKTYSAKSSVKNPSTGNAAEDQVDDGQAATAADATPPIDPTIPADALWRKIITIIPVIGIITNVINQNSLDKCSDCNVLPEKNVWEIKRQYQGISIARSLLEVAIVARVVALGILGFKLGVVVAAVPVIMLAVHVYKCVQASLQIKNCEAST